MSLTKLPLGRNNSVMTSLFPPVESLVVTSRLGMGNWRTFFLRCILRSKLEIYALVTFLALSAHSTKNLLKVFDQTYIPLIVYNKQLINEEVKLPTSLSIDKAKIIWIQFSVLDSMGGNFYDWRFEWKAWNEAAPCKRPEAYSPWFTAAIASPLKKGILKRPAHFLLSSYLPHPPLP